MSLSAILETITLNLTNIRLYDVKMELEKKKKLLFIASYQLASIDNFFLYTDKIQSQMYCLCRCSI